ncbi:MAG: 3-phosphoshikimate 1-carboxyvinyltransferase [Gammaproteobacteria bacterium]
MNQPENNYINYLIQPSTSLNGKFLVPGDKSISHRALMLSAIADGQSTIHGLLKSEDCLATLAALNAMNVFYEETDNKLLVNGVGLHGLKKPTYPLDLGNSGTALRLLTGILAGQTFDSIVTGDDSLRNRPMGRIIKPLQKMGAQIESQDEKPPLSILGGKPLHGIDFELPVASAQVKSSILLAGLYAEGKTIIHEPIQSRDHTERMFATFGCDITQKNNTITLFEKQSLSAAEVFVPGDISSAAFFMVAASIVPDSILHLLQVGINPTRTGIITLLKEMGADITIQNERLFNQEPVADLIIRSAPLSGITISPDLVPATIDEFPILFIAAACAKGRTILRQAQELRVKESDRLFAMAKGLSQLGIKVEVFEDGLAIEGGAFSGGAIDSFGDHRIAMAFAMAGTVAKNPILVKNCANIATSFPNFYQLAQKSGIIISYAD